MNEPMESIASVLSPLDWRNYLDIEGPSASEIAEYGQQRAEARVCLRRIYELTAQLNEMLGTAATYQVPLTIRVNGTSDSKVGFDLVIFEDRESRTREVS